MVVAATLLFNVITVPLIAQSALSANSTSAQDLALHVGAGLGIPLIDSADLFSIGGFGNMAVEWGFPAGMPFYLKGALGYDYAPLKAGPTGPNSVSILQLGAGVGVRLPILPWLYAKGYVQGGYYYGMINGSSSSNGGGSPFAAGGVELAADITSLLSFEVGGAYQELFGFYRGVGAYLNSTFHLGNGNRSPIVKTSTMPPLQRQKAEAIDFKELTFESVFPVFYSYYDTHPVGALLISNKKKSPITDVKVSLFIKQYMDSPKTCASIAELKAGDTRSVDLFALFTDRVLDITEATKVAVDITVDYKLEGNSEQDVRTETLRMYDRNAMTWVDDRRAAAFITTKDPQVLTFAKNVVGMLRDKEGRFLSDKLLLGIGIHEALTAYGITYVVDPTSPFSNASKNKEETDFLQFPRQTLEYKAGDCDDLTILNCALFESVGIGTAFITVPGHIYMAFRLEMNAEEAKRSFLRPDDLIFRDDGVWVPLEITEIKGGFLKAWEIGAREWRESDARKQAAFYPTQEAWKDYEPAGLPGAGVAVAVPTLTAVMTAVNREINRFIESEVGGRVAKLQDDMKKAGQTAKGLNQIGILYGRYGVFDMAETFFLGALKKEEYLPSLINLGNLYYLTDSPDKAYTYFGRAVSSAPKNTKALQGYILAGYELQKYDAINSAYGTLKSLAPELASQISFVESRSDATARAGNAGNPAQGVSLWSE
jgi:tetratricopeptide (TPR) repeat protein